MGWLWFAKAGNLFDCKNGQAMPTVAIREYLKNVEERELEADLVLGDDEGKECIYNNGYVKRQTIFSCLTCTPDGNDGVFKMILGEGEFQEIPFKNSRQPA